MSNDPFDTPAHGDMFNMADALGALLLIDVKSIEHGVVTEFGTFDVPKCDIAVLDGNNKGTTYTDALIFGRVMYTSLSPKVGKKVLGRAEQGEKKPGKNAPWQLADPTDADKQTARDWIAAAETDEMPF